MRILPLLLLAALAFTADNPLAKTATAALAGDDPYAKRDAVKALGDKGAIDDDAAYPIIVQAVGDRAAHDAAVAAFRARSGLTPPSSYAGGTQYPGYPASEDTAGFAAWHQAWKKAMDEKKRLADLEKKVDKSKPKAAAGADDAKPADEAPADVAPVAPPKIQTDGLGKLDRIVYKSGRSLIAYIRSKRTDADGNIVSLRVVHKDGDGEEVIDMAQVARIEEDIE